ncbi:MAG TPA: copper-binding protein [Thauera sp.]|uniref:copper-binding protein n=1 Tax=Thauera sp. TaxID=1905334 RepID=UPI002CC33A63|nr:copper-binding protein [Thauera sp.]HRP24511.1 copper-binding protein [Thauera sp.]HRP66958.1 copper-binding protein [Thauera sp.]
MQNSPRITTTHPAHRDRNTASAMTAGAAANAAGRLRVGALTLACAGALALWIAAAPVQAQQGHDGHHGQGAPAVPAAAEAGAAQFAPSEGEVKRLDKAGKRVTIAHGPLENLGMPPMTMAFEVEDAAVVDALKVGDRIRFIAGKEGRRYTARDVEVVQ